MLAGVQAGSDILAEEIFGPGRSRSSRSPTRTRPSGSPTTPSTGSSAYVFTKDLARGQRMIERLETGMLGLNAGVISNAAAPFGGVKQSGLGREGGLEGIHEYLSTKYTMTPDPTR